MHLLLKVQGAIISFTNEPELSYVFLTQECDLTHYCILDEPYADICQVTAFSDGDKLPPINSFRITLIDGEDGQKYVAEQKNRKHIPRLEIYDDNCNVITKPTADGYRDLK